MWRWNEQHKDLFCGQTKGGPAGLKITPKLTWIKSASVNLNYADDRDLGYKKQYSLF